MFHTILKSCASYLPFPAVGLILSTFLTYLAVFFLPRLGYIDIPRGRHQHEKPVPRGGGIAIGTAFFVTVLLLSVMLQEQSKPMYATVMEFLSRFWLPGGIILIVGMIDDRCELRSIVKLIAQIIVGVIIHWQGGGIFKVFSYQIPDVAALALTVGWCVIIINAFNLIDGVDGIAAGLSVISSFLLAVWTLLTGESDAMVIVLLIFCGCCLGFLRYNFSPAKIFMGDTGSMFIGLFFAFMSMQCSTKSVTLTTLLVPLVAIGVPVFDVFLAVWRRFFRRYINKDPSSSIMQGDHDHLHHRILKETGMPRKTAYIIYCLSFGLSLLAMCSVILEAHFPGMIFLLLLIVFFVMVRYSSIELFDTLTCVAKGLSIPHRNFVLTAIHPVIDGVLVIFALWFARYFYTWKLSGSLPEAVLFLTHVAPFMLILCCAGIYRTFWLRVGIIQYYKMMRLLGVAAVVGYVLNCSLLSCKFDVGRNELAEYTRFYLAFLLFTVLFILFERFLIHYYESFGYRRLFIRNQGRDSSLKRVLIYGGGLLCRIYVTRQFCGFNLKNNVAVKIIGIIDDDPALRKLNVYGFNVLGSSGDIENIYSKYKFDAIVVTYNENNEDKMAKLKEFCKAHGIELNMFICREESVSI